MRAAPVDPGEAAMHARILFELFAVLVEQPRDAVSGFHRRDFDAAGLRLDDLPVGRIDEIQLGGRIGHVG